MTAALLRTLPDPPPHGRVLDFACGSGIIAAALIRRKPSIHLHLLDADILAVQAARHNVPLAKRFFLSNCWPACDRDAKQIRYNWIVSNPLEQN
eukprot:gnl/TRDRNA2_/TRDRNA2_72167_c0_seq2.p1 gnl/TRDRNA2_/TRDRNA2_72167_c0~~gnl/TRDRNA2_/TRDRNA2_72167_c0_seq2.p1  ORF type:complete len:105 (-),score=16.30 gnl/TRDRNA2_/TRDRNA2_72167_c0_seq2:1-282(-)